MVSNYVWIGITMGLFVVGIASGYAVFLTNSSYEPISMKFQNQQLFDQMMSQNPRMINQWMSTMMEDEEFMQEMTEMMSEHGAHEPMMGSMMEQTPMEEHEMMLEMVDRIMDDEHLREHMIAHMIEHQQLTHQVLTFMSQDANLKKHMEAHITGGDLSPYESLGD